MINVALLRDDAGPKPVMKPMYTPVYGYCLPLHPSRSEHWSLDQFSESPFKKRFKRDRYTLNSCRHMKINATVVAGLDASYTAHAVDRTTLGLVTEAGIAYYPLKTGSMSWERQGFSHTLSCKMDPNTDPLITADSRNILVILHSVDLNGNIHTVTVQMHSLVYRADTFDITIEFMDSGTFTNAQDAEAMISKYRDQKPRQAVGLKSTASRTDWPVPILTSKVISWGTLVSAVNSSKIVMTRDYPTMSDFQDSLFLRAVERYRPEQTNLLEYVVGMKELPATIRQLPELAHATSIKLKDLAALYLSYIYGIAPMPHDTQIIADIGSVLNRNNSMRLRFDSNQPFHSRGWSGVARATIYLRPPVDVTAITGDDILDAGGPLMAGSLVGATLPKDKLQEIANALSDAGIPVSLEQLTRILWEGYVPFSFVVDWFLDISGKLKFLENLKYFQSLPIEFLCRSIKAQISRTDDLVDCLSKMLDAPCSARCDVTLYERSYSSTLDIAPIMEPFDPSFSLSRWFQGGALIVQKLPHGRK